jgi:molecular chaperone DnaJ
MANGKDYYQVLGVGKNASQDEIKQAYKKLAKEHHPDMVGESNKETAEKRFKEINEAYQVLSDTQKRKMYDQYGTTDPNMGGFGGFGGQNTGGWGPFTYSYSSGQGGQQSGNPFDFGNSDFDPLDIFEQFFGFRGFGGAKRPRKGKNLNYEMWIEFKDAVFGMEKDINTDAGRVRIKVPAGVRDGNEIRFEGNGMPAADKSAPNGDLFISIRIKYPEGFKIIQDTIVVTASIDFAEAALGVIVEVPIVDLNTSNGLGKTQLKIPAGTQYGAQFIIRGKGLPMLHRKNQGDVLVQVLINTPSKLSNERKRLLEEYLKSR